MSVSPVVRNLRGRTRITSYNVCYTKLLRSKNKNGKLEFVDLAAAASSATGYGVSAAAVKEQLHARDASGQVFTGTDALFAAHAAVGLANWFEMCRLPGFLSVGTGIGPKP